MNVFKLDSIHRGFGGDTYDYKGSESGIVRVSIGWGLGEPNAITVWVGLDGNANMWDKLLEFVGNHGFYGTRSPILALKTCGVMVSDAIELPGVKVNGCFYGISFCRKCHAMWQARDWELGWERDGLTLSTCEDCRREACAVLTEGAAAADCGGER